MKRLKKWFYNLSLGHKVGIGFFVLFLFFLGISGILWFYHQKINKEFEESINNLYLNLIAIEELRSDHIRWKVNLLTNFINEDYESIKPDESFLKLDQFRKFKEYQISDNLWNQLETYFKQMNEQVEKIRQAKTPEEAHFAFNKFQEPSKKYLWEGLEKFLEEYFTFLQKENEKAKKVKIYLIIVYTIAIFALIAVFIFGISFISKRLRKELDGVIKSSRKIAQGDFRVNLVLNRKDEMGIIYRALDEIKGSFNELVLHSQRIGQKIKPLIESFNQLSKEVRDKSFSTEGIINEVSENLGEILSNIEEQVNLLSQLKLAIEDISRMITQTAHSAKDSLEKAQLAQEMINQLEEASQEIEKIVEFIRSLAEQTNLLALNASIEAARAGEAGKGFAVVANEVKELARQTDEAGKEITKKIGSLQELHHRIIHAVSEITLTFEQVRDLANTAAGAVEEQSIAVKDIENQGENIKEKVYLVNEKAKSIYESFKPLEESIQKNTELIGHLDEFIQELMGSLSHYQTYQTDRRDFTRIIFYDEVEFMIGGKNYKGLLKDFCVGGLYLYSDFKPLVGDKVNLVIRIEDESFLLDGEVIRRDPDGFAVKYTYIDEDNLNRLRKILQRYLPPNKVEQELEKFLNGLYRRG